MAPSVYWEIYHSRNSLDVMAKPVGLQLYETVLTGVCSGPPQAPGLSLTSALPAFRTEPAHVDRSLELAIILGTYDAELAFRVELAVWQ